eukprot:3908407-Amphidinium_carterae.1
MDENKPSQREILLTRACALAKQHQSTTTKVEQALMLHGDNPHPEASSASSASRVFSARCDHAGATLSMKRLKCSLGLPANACRQDSTSK